MINSPHAIQDDPAPDPKYKAETVKPQQTHCGCDAGHPETGTVYSHQEDNKVDITLPEHGHVQRGPQYDTDTGHYLYAWVKLRI